MVAAAIFGLVWFLRAEFQTESQTFPEGTVSAVELTVDGSAPLDERARALIHACAVESGHPADRIEQVADDRFRYTTSPAMDDDDIDKVIGCLQDLRIDNVIGDVKSVDQVVGGTHGLSSRP